MICVDTFFTKPYLLNHGIIAMQLNNGADVTRHAVVMLCKSDKYVFMTKYFSEGSAMQGKITFTFFGSFIDVAFALFLVTF